MNRIQLKNIRCTLTIGSVNPQAHEAFKHVSLIATVVSVYEAVAATPGLLLHWTPSQRRIRDFIIWGVGCITGGMEGMEYIPPPNGGEGFKMYLHLVAFSNG